MSVRTDVNELVSGLLPLVPLFPRSIVEATALKLGKYKVCLRCGGEGKYAFTSRYGSHCLKCDGRGYTSREFDLPKIKEVIFSDPEGFKKRVEKETARVAKVVEARTRRMENKEHARKQQILEKQLVALNALNEEDRLAVQAILSSADDLGSFINDVVSRFNTWGTMTEKQARAIIATFNNLQKKKTLHVYAVGDMTDMYVTVVKIETIQVPGFMGGVADINKVTLQAEDGMIVIIKTNRSTLVKTLENALDNKTTLNLLGRVKWVAPSNSPIVIAPAGIQIYEQ